MTAKTLDLRDWRLQHFERWLADPHGPPGYVYHVGELARDKVRDPALAAVAQRALELSDCSKAVVSRCGHVRGWLTGARRVRLVTRRERGETLYIAVRAAGAV